MERWNEICFIINKHKERNSAEDFFQNEIEHIFEKLGWSRYRNEIIPKLRIRVGATNSVLPDIIIKNENRNLFVIELKKPNQPSLSTHIDQLTSYMRLLRLNFGIYIGDNIQLYFDEPSDTEKPIKIFETNFVENNEEGAKFIDLISKQTFHEKNLLAFCEAKLEEANDRNIATDLINKISSNDGVEKLLKLLIAELKNDYNDNIIKNVVENITIKINPKFENVNIKSITTESFNTNIESRSATSGKLPIELIPNDVDEFKRKFIEIGSAILCFHYENGRIEEKIWKKVNFSESADLKANLRSRPEARKGKWKELGIAKLVCKINYPTIN